MRILVTGGAGYCGVPLCEALLQRGHKVTVVDNLMFGAESILHLIPRRDLEVVQRDIRHTDRSYLKDQDVIFHLAAISGYPECASNAHSVPDINVEATSQIVDALSPDQLLIYPSTTSFYGKTGEVSTEETVPAPVSLYGTTKWQAERRVMEHPNAIAIRWPTVFGVSARMRSSLLVNDFVAHAVRDRVINLYDADSRRTFMHISDLVRGYLFALDNASRMAGGVFNMGAERMNYTKREVATCIQSQLECKLIDTGVLDKDLRNFNVSYGKANALGYDTTVTLEEGIDELARLFKFYTPNHAIRPI